MAQTLKANGAEIPVIGFGTWDLRGGAVVPAVQAALAAGYRHIDTAAMYGNETEVGAGLRASGLPRNDVFITTKVWPSEAGDGPFQRSAEASVKRLKVDRVDLLLIHWPSRTVPLKEQVAVLCKTKRLGLARHVGVSNFSAEEIAVAMDVADEPIVTNQIEYHPYLDQSATFEACAKHGIAITSYSPLGRGRLLDDPVIVRIAKGKGRTPAQVVLRWHIQHPGNIAIPKSANARRIAENIAIFDFALTPAEFGAMSKLARSSGGPTAPG